MPESKEPCSARRAKVREGISRMCKSETSREELLWPEVLAPTAQGSFGCAGGFASESSGSAQDDRWGDLRRHRRALALLLYHYRVQELHHGPQARAHFFNQLLLLAGALGIEPLAPGLVLLDPVARIGAVLDFAQHLSHGLAGFVGDHPRTAGIVAVLGGVAHRVAHVVKPAAVNQVHNQLQLVQ